MTAPVLARTVAHPAHVLGRREFAVEAVVAIAVGTLATAVIAFAVVGVWLLITTGGN